MTTARPPITSDAMARFSRVFATMSLCIGVGMIIGGGYFMHRLHLDEFVLHPEPVEGVVLGNKAVRGKGTAYAAIVGFADSTGLPQTFQDPMAFGLPSFSEGQKVKIFYDPLHPESAMVDRGIKNYVVPSICLLFAGFCLLGGWQRIAMERRRAASSTAATA